jgi:hypothetical protein
MSRFYEITKVVMPLKFIWWCCAKLSGVDFISGRGTTSKRHQPVYTSRTEVLCRWKVGTTGNVATNNSQEIFIKEDEVGVSCYL